MTAITDLYNSLPYSTRKAMRDSVAIAIPIVAGGLASGQTPQEIVGAVILAVAGLFGWRVTRK